jgi:CRISPR/Cas system-associated protein Csx1
VKENRLEMMMVNDVPFPATALPILNIKCVISATILHPLYQKYKSKFDDKKIYTNEFPIAKTEISNSTKYMKLNSRKRITETMSTE